MNSDSIPEIPIKHSADSLSIKQLNRLLRIGLPLIVAFSIPWFLWNNMEKYDLSK